MSIVDKKGRLANLQQCLDELKVIHQAIIRNGVETSASRKELQDCITQQVAVIRLMQSEARLSSTVAVAATAFAGSVAGGLLTLLVRIV
jgi:hypothetical protein